MAPWNGPNDLFCVKWDAKPHSSQPISFQHVLRKSRGMYQYVVWSLGIQWSAMAAAAVLSIRLHTAAAARCSADGRTVDVRQLMAGS